MQALAVGDLQAGPDDRGPAEGRPGRLAPAAHRLAWTWLDAVSLRTLFVNEQCSLADTVRDQRRRGDGRLPDDGDHGMKLGLLLGFWGADGPPSGLVAPRQGGPQHRPPVGGAVRARPRPVRAGTGPGMVRPAV